MTKIYQYILNQYSPKDVSEEKNISNANFLVHHHNIFVKDLKVNTNLGLC